MYSIRQAKLRGVTKQLKVLQAHNVKKLQVKTNISSLPKIILKTIA